MRRPTQIISRTLGALGVALFASLAAASDAGMPVVHLAPARSDVNLSSPAIEAETAFHEPPVDTKVMHELYPNGALAIERHVKSDENGNLTLQGPWSMFSPSGQLLGSGRYENGKRHGPWVRHYCSHAEAEILAGNLKRAFTAPFTSTATFRNGKLDGTWRIVDAVDREVICWNYADGRRHGLNVWRYPNGQAWHEMTYNRGQLTGEFLERDDAGKLLAREVYLDGRRLETKVQWYRPGVKKAEAKFLLAKEVTEDTEDWWQGTSRTRVVKHSGTDERHGKYTLFYENGEKAMEANFLHDRPTGTLAWWHGNGQQAIAGEYRDGQQHGDWTWWHANGEIRIEGHYDRGQQQGHWTWWNEEGLMLRIANFSDKVRVIVPASASQQTKDGGRRSEIGGRKIEVRAQKPEIGTPPAPPQAPRLLPAF